MIKAVVFDKDGTILEFSSFWIRGIYALLDELNLDSKSYQDLKLAIGIGEDDQVIENSILAAGTINDLAEILSEYYPHETRGLEGHIEDKFVDVVEANPHEVRGTCNLFELFEYIKSQDIKIIVSTSDNLIVASKMFDILNVSSYIDVIISADRYPKKPDRSSLNSIMDEFDLKSDEIIMVGDSWVDMEYGKDLHSTVGVLCGTGKVEMLSQYADVVMESPQELITYIDKQNKNC